jgi:TonB-linked SusC/RagA family outer membrane protein
MKNKFICTIVISFFALQVMAQTKISGVITDAKDKAPLPGVSVILKGSNIGTVSDANGNYSIQVQNATDVLIFSYLGYTTQELRAGSGTLNVGLASQQNALSEVVVIGYGTSKKSDLTGAVTTVKAEQLLDRPVPNLSQALQGKVTGVDVSVNNTTPGAGAKVRIRGIGSINSNIDPVYVVDGVVGVDPNSINPNDIASVEVLKDASSTAIYGVRGANGIIMVTTKRGRKGPATISYDANGNISQLARSVPTLNSAQFIKMYNEAYANGAKFNGGTVVSPPKALNHANYPLLFDNNDNPLYDTNWEKETYKPAFSQSHQVNIQGGSEKSLYSLSMGYFNQHGLAPTSAFKRYSVKFTLDNDVKDWLRVGASANLISSLQRNVSDGNGGLNVPRAVSEEVPIIPVKYPNGQWAGNFDIAGLEGAPNPVHIANNRYNLNNTLQMVGNVYALFKITNDLDFKTDLGFDLAARKNNFFAAQDLQHLSSDQGGIANINAYRDYFWQSENYLTWNKKINDRQKLTALAGFSLSKRGYERVRSETQNFIDDFFQWHYQQAGSVKQANESQDEQNQLMSFFGRVTYNLDEKYLFTATGRYDGSSRFADKNKFSFFPSVGAAWRVSEEDFLKGNSSITNLKVRASWGLTGNQEIGNYRTISQYQASTTVLNGAAASTLRPNILGNPDLKWERTEQADAGVELSLWGDRVNLTADYYVRTTKDLLLQAPIPWSAGYVTANVYKNVGSVRNSGIELSLNVVPVKTKDFDWTLNFLFTANKNKVLKLNDNGADIFPGPNFLGQNFVIRVGEPIGSFYGRTRLGTWGESEAAEAASHNLKPGDRKYKYNADGSEYYSVIGQAYPKWNGTISSGIRYKNLDFSFDIRIVQGVNTAANFKHSVEDRQTLSNNLATALDAWTPTHQNTYIAQVRPYANAQDSKFDTWWVEDGSFIRGQNITLGYTFPGEMVKKLNMSRLRIYASVQNWFLITDYTGYDPEVDTFVQSYGSNTAFSQNVDFFANPRPRVWNLGLQVGF